MFLAEDSTKQSVANLRNEGIVLSMVEDNLVGSERVAYRAHVHMITYSRALLATIVAIAAFSLGAKVQTKPELFEYAGLLCLLVAAGFAFVAYLRIQTSDFAVTNRRVIIQVGYLNRTSLEIFLAKVEGISINQTLIGRIFNFGDISIRGGGGIQEDFQMVAAPYTFRRYVQLLSDAIASK